MAQRGVKRSVDTAPIESKFGSTSTMSAPVSNRYESAPASGASAAAAAASAQDDHRTDLELFDDHVEEQRNEYFAEITKSAASAAEAEAETVTIPAELPDVVEENARDVISEIARDSYYDLKQTRAKMTSLDGTVTVRFTGVVDVLHNAGIGSFVDCHAKPATGDSLRATLQGKTKLDNEPCNAVVLVTGISDEHHVGADVSLPLNPKTTMVKPFYIEVDKVIPSMNSIVTISADVAGPHAEHNLKSSTVVLPDRNKKEKCTDLYWIRPTLLVQLAGQAMNKARGEDSEVALSRLFAKLNASIQTYGTDKTGPDGSIVKASHVEVGSATVTLLRESSKDGKEKVVWDDLPDIIELMNQSLQIEDAGAVAVSASANFVTVTKKAWNFIKEVIAAEAGKSMGTADSLPSLAEFVTLEQALSFHVRDIALTTHLAMAGDKDSNGFIKDCRANPRAPFAGIKLTTSKMVSDIHSEKIMFSGYAVVYMGSVAGKNGK